MKRSGVLVVCLLSPTTSFAQDAGPDGAPPDGGFDAGDPDLCVEFDWECNPGLRCIDGRCGVCDDAETRACDEGCGPGTQTCLYATRSWGPCEPDGAVECQPPETRPCDHPCGPWGDNPGNQPCDATSCTWSEDCFNVGPVECLPGLTGECLTPGTLCRGSRVCGDDCSFGDCIPDPTVCECAGGSPCCGNGVRDPGEECDTEPQCGSTCRWSSARPFRSCDCRAPGAGEPSTPSVSLVGALFAVAARRRRRGG